jgi:hypothetical protein
MEGKRGRELVARPTGKAVDRDFITQPNTSEHQRSS